MKIISEFTKYLKVLSVFFFLLFFCSLSMAQDEAPVQDEAISQKIVIEAKKYYDLKAYDKAFPLFQEAAKAGNVEAYTFLGKMYYNGWGIPHNHEAAYEWHKKAAEAGSEESKEKLNKFKHKTEEHQKQE